MDVQFGISFEPSAQNPDWLRIMAQTADRLGFDLIGIQDHPYHVRFLDTWTLIATLVPMTNRVKFFPDVANLPLRPPAMLAKAVASLDLLSGGRIELGLGAGAAWTAIAAMGGPTRDGPQALRALEEAITIIRQFWSGGSSITVEGEHYQVRGLRAGPTPAHPVSIWVGGYRPKMLALIGRLADGWIPSSPYAPPQTLTALNAQIDDAAVRADRNPADIRRLYNVMGLITPHPGALFMGPPAQWINELTDLVTTKRMDTVIFWPAQDHVRQVERFAAEVIPAVRAAAKD